MSAGWYASLFAYPGTRLLEITKSLGQLPYFDYESYLLIVFVTWGATAVAVVAA